MNAKTLPIAPIAEDVREGLLANPKRLSPKLFYDARGSELFEQITRLPEYYLTETERAIFQVSAADMIEAAGDDLSVVELGAGSGSKTVLLLQAVVARQRSASYYPVDVSSAALEDCDRRIAEEVAEVELNPVVADYTSGLPFLRRLKGRKLVLYIGSSIGNFEPIEAAGILARIGSSMAPGDAILLGTDMRKSPERLVPAYDDAQGVTAEFNKNVLVRINRELGANFDLECFAHRAIWNSRQSRIEMHLESLADQTVWIRDLGMSVKFACGETIHTENSYK